MKRRLLYVPMAHLERESMHLILMKSATGAENDPRRTSTISFDDAYEYWVEVLDMTLRSLSALRPERFDVFCEDWSSHRQLRFAQEHAARRAENFEGVLSFVSVMITIGGQPRITEDSRALRLADRAVQKQVRLFRTRNLVPAMKNDLVIRRDKCIAMRLDQVVSEGGIAILCMGAGHDVPAHLNDSWATTIITTQTFYERFGSLRGRRQRWAEAYLLQQ